MCRRPKTSCDLLGAPESWSAVAPLTLEWLDGEVLRLREAAALLAKGQFAEARGAIERLRAHEANWWFDEHAQMTGFHRVRHRGHNEEWDRTPRTRTPERLRKKVWARDRYICRYCGTRTIDRNVSRAISQLIGPALFPWGSRNKEMHGIALAARTEYDHVHPLARGGTDDEANLVTACAACNYGKHRYTVAEIGISDPRDRPPRDSEWDGLTGFLPALNHRVAMQEEGKATSAHPSDVCSTVGQHVDQASTSLKVALDRQMEDFLKRTHCADSALIEDNRRAIVRLISWSIKHSPALQPRAEDGREAHVGVTHRVTGVTVWSTYFFETGGKVALLPRGAGRLSDTEREGITAVIETLARGRSIRPRQTLEIPLIRIASEDAWSTFEPSLDLARSAAGRPVA